MKTKNRMAGTTELLPLVLLLTLPAVGHAQYTFETNSGTITITRYLGSGGAVTIPDATNGLPVTRIGDAAFGFEFGSNVTSVTIPNSVTGIGSLAFDGCNRLASVTIGNSVTSIGESTFWGCTSLTSVSIPDSVASIGRNAFMSCTNLTRVTLGTGVTTIGDSVFSMCTRLDGVYFKGNAPSVGLNAFLGEDKATVYYVSGTTGWGPTFAGLSTAVWTPYAVQFARNQSMRLAGDGWGDAGLFNFGLGRWDASASGYGAFSLPYPLRYNAGNGDSWYGLVVNDRTLGRFVEVVWLWDVDLNP